MNLFAKKCVDDVCLSKLPEINSFNRTCRASFFLFGRSHRVIFGIHLETLAVAASASPGRFFYTNMRKEIESEDMEKT